MKIIDADTFDEQELKHQMSAKMFDLEKAVAKCFDAKLALETIIREFPDYISIIVDGDDVVNIAVKHDGETTKTSSYGCTLTKIQSNE